MELKEILENKKKYEDINKELSMLINKTYNQKENIFMNTFFIIMLLGMTGSIFIAPNIGAYTLISISTIAGMAILFKILWKKYQKKFKASDKLKLFHYNNKTTNNFAKKYKKELSIYKKENYIDLFYQTVKNKIENSEEKEIKEAAIPLRNYLISLNKNNLNSKNKLEGIIAKKLKKEKKKIELEKVNSLLDIKVVKKVVPQELKVVEKI